MLLVPSFVCSLNQCVLRTDESVTAVIRKLKADKATLRKGAFDELEKTLGFTYCEEGALFDENFMATIPGPVSMTSYDWMHVYLVSGHLLLSKVKEGHGIGVSSLPWPKKMSSRSLSGIRAVEKLKHHLLEKQARPSGLTTVWLRCWIFSRGPDQRAFRPLTLDTVPSTFDHYF